MTDIIEVVYKCPEMRVTIEQFCALRGLSAKTARRWISRGKLKVVGKKRGARGRPALLVTLPDVGFARQPTATKHRPASVLFARRCEEHGHDPRLVLLRLLLGCDQDPDLLRAGISLTRSDAFGDFLAMLAGARKPDQEFKGFVASKLARPEARMLDERRDELPAMRFNHFWRRAQKDVRVWAPLVYPSFAVSADDEAPRIVWRPRYVDGFRGHKPKWAFESVYQARATLPKDLTEFLRRVRGKIWNPDVVRPTPTPAAQEFSRAVEAAQAGDLKHGVALLARLGLPEETAREFLSTWVARRLSQGKLNASAVARVFGLCPSIQSHWKRQPRPVRRSTRDDEAPDPPDEEFIANKFKDHATYELTRDRHNAPLHR